MTELILIIAIVIITLLVTGVGIYGIYFSWTEDEKFDAKDEDQNKLHED